MQQFFSKKNKNQQKKAQLSMLDVKLKQKEDCMLQNDAKNIRKEEKEK